MFILSFYFYAYATCNLGPMKEVIILSIILLMSSFSSLTATKIVLNIESILFFNEYDAKVFIITSVLKLVFLCSFYSVSKELLKGNHIL